MGLLTRSGLLDRVFFYSVYSIVYVCACTGYRARVLLFALEFSTLSIGFDFLIRSPDGFTSGDTARRAVMVFRGLLVFHVQLGVFRS